MALADVVHRIATDATFAAHMRRDPEAALKTANLTLEVEEIEAVLAVLRGKVHWENLCSPSLNKVEAMPWWIDAFNHPLISHNPSSLG